MNLTDAYLLGSYTEFLVLIPYLVKTHEEKGLIRMRERALREIRRILNSNKILTNIIDEISNSLEKLEKEDTQTLELKPKDVSKLGRMVTEWRSEISRELKSV